MFIGPDKQKNEHKIVYILGTQKNRLIETAVSGTLKTLMINKKKNLNYALLSLGMTITRPLCTISGHLCNTCFLYFSWKNGTQRYLILRTTTVLRPSQTGGD